jgi:nitrile hydratase
LSPPSEHSPSGLSKELFDLRSTLLSYSEEVLCTMIMTDPAYKARLMENATAAIAELGFSGVQGEHMVAVENTDAVHNLVVCTLCSCYPLPVLGLPPVWYKSAPYRSRAVLDPRGVLAEFGLTVPASKEIRVWDSTAEIRYLVIPQRPSGTEGWPVEELATLVTRDSMIGTGLALNPQTRGKPS